MNSFYIGLLGQMAAKLEEAAKAGIELEQENAKAEYRATHDNLTGLLNRLGFMINSKKVLASHPNPENLVVVVLDLDGLKSINDTFGHLAGDRAIETSGKFLGKHFRENDLVSHNLAGRVGGDEFYVLADLTPRNDEGRKLTKKERLEKLLARLEDNFYSQVASQNTDLDKLRISAGAVFIDPESPFESTIHSADTQMYLNKRSRRS